MGGNNYLKSSTNIDLKGLSYGNSPGMQHLNPYQDMQRIHGSAATLGED